MQASLERQQKEGVNMARLQEQQAAIRQEMMSTGSLNLPLSFAALLARLVGALAVYELCLEPQFLQ